MNKLHCLEWVVNKQKREERKMKGKMQEERKEGLLDLEIK